MRTALSVLLVYFFIASIITLLWYYLGNIERRKKISLWLIFLITSIGSFIGGFTYYLFSDLIAIISEFAGTKLLPPILGGIIILLIYSKLNNKHKD